MEEQGTAGRGVVGVKARRHDRAWITQGMERDWARLGSQGSGANSRRYDW